MLPEKTQNINAILKEFWGYEDFIHPQEEIISSILSQKDTFAILPTGGGKSLCFQVPAIALRGITLVVSPLIALMKDQVQSLKNKGISAELISSELSQNDIIRVIDNCQYGNVKLLYVSPERLQNALFVEIIQKLDFSLFAIDEAHCISEWGHDFRPAYLKIHKLRESYPNIPILALTASATPKIQTEIIEKLKLKEPQIFKRSLSRKNLSYSVFNSFDKYSDLIYNLKKYPGSSIVFVRNRKSTFEISEFLNQNGFKADYFHAKLPGFEKNKKQKNWIESSETIMVATNAFGMGIDKANVRTVFHLDLPNGVESYFQEVGRGGRDGKNAKGIFLLKDADITKSENIFKSNLPNKEEFVKIAQMLYTHLDVGELEKPEITFEFNFTKFAEKFNFNKKTIQKVLDFLQNKEIIFLQNKRENSSIQLLFSANKFTFNNRLKEDICNYLARNHPGIFTNKIEINEFQIARDLNKNIKKIRENLRRLHDEEILIYEDYALNKIDFLVPREMQLIKNKYWKEFELIQQTNWKRLQDLIYFLKQKDVCRERLLLKYFGEKTSENCGKCDVCQNKNINSNINKEALLLFFDKEESKTLEEILLQFINSPSETVLELLQELIDEQKIVFSGIDSYRKK